MSDDASRKPQFSEDVVRRAKEELEAWEQQELSEFLARVSERQDDFKTGSDIPLQRVYTPADISDLAWEDLALPGQPPFTRGPYPTMYRARPWTMRQIAGFGRPAETNERFRFLIEQGQTGISVDFDMPTLMGYDSDHPMSLGEVGREGVAIDVLPDMESLFDEIDLEQISVSMTINPTAWILLAMYVAVVEERGYDLSKVSGTIQNDILKEYIAQKEWIYPIRPSMRIVRDTVDYCSRHLSRFNPINISGYHISEAGATAVQEAAFTMANTRAYVQEFTESGLDVDSFAPRLSFFFVSQADFFEEIAKFRALRRTYARMMREEFGAKRPESQRLRFHTQTAAATLTRAQPLNNIVRTALQALSAVLGGTQSLHTNGMDEAYTIPSEQAMKVALRTQQIIADESNVTSSIDPLGGSYLVESLTDEIEGSIHEYLERIEGVGGTIAAIESGFFQREIADSAYKYAQSKGSGESAVVGVNRYVDDGDDQNIQVHRLDPESEHRQIDALHRVRARRDEAAVARVLGDLRTAAGDPSANIMPLTIRAVRAHASMGEVVESLREVFGSYEETPVF